MSFDFSKWASQSLAKIEGTLDQAFGLESTELQQSQTAAPPSLPSLFSIPSAPSSETVAEQKSSDDNLTVDGSENSETISLHQPVSNNLAESDNYKSAVTKDTAPIKLQDDCNNNESGPTSEASIESLRSLLEQQKQQCTAQSEQLALLHAEKMDLEVKLSQVSSMERELRGLVNELTAKEPNAAQTELQRTKDQLQSLLLEGEQWSKRQMKLEGVLKTLRKEMKAKESEISGLRTDAVTTAQTIQTLTDKCHTQAETEKGLLERIASLTGQFNELKAELERLMRESVLQDKETIESVAVTERLEAKLRAQQIEAAHWKVAFDEQSELQVRICVMQDQLKEGEIREETLRRNVIDLSAELKCLKAGSDQERVQLRDQLQQAREQLDRALSQTEQLRQEIPLATQPLLKQIATLQALLKSQTEKSESTESKLLRKLAEAKKRFETRRSSMQTSESNLVDAQKANEELKSELDSARKQNEMLLLEISELRETTESLRGSLNLKAQHCDSLHKKLTKDKNDAQEGANKLQEEFAYAVANASRLQKELEETRSALAPLELTSLQQSQDARTDVRRINDERRQRSRELSDSKIDIQDANDSKNSVFAYEMNTQLRRQEAELVSLRERLLEIERDNDILAEKLVEASVKSSSDLETIKNLQAQFDALNVRHDIALNIIGEKTDQVDELKADLKECKAIFKEQLESLLRQQGQGRQNVGNSRSFD